jgi:hypothetical protein
MTHRDRVRGPLGRRGAAGDAGHHQGFPTPPPIRPLPVRPRDLYESLIRTFGIRRPHRGHGPSSASTACGAMEATSSGQARRRRLRSNKVPEFRESGTDVPVGTAASARSTEASRCLE